MTCSRILVVEDNPDNYELVRFLLENNGHQVLAARTGRQGLEMAAQELPDLILMDLSLPDVDGWEATRRIKGQAATAAIPVIVLTAHAMAGDREKAMEAGADDYDTKPVEFRRLLQKIESFLGSTQE